VEVLLLAQRLGFRVADMPVEWINSPESKVHIVRDSFRMLRDAIGVRRLVERNLRRADSSR
jgi:dolichyl-phosphate beta-glucosyltransferase